MSKKTSVSDGLKAIAKEYYPKLLEENKSIEGIFLTGSVARNEAVEDSDIDLLIIDNKVDLNSDQQDNMKEALYKGIRFSLIRTNLSKLGKNIQDGIAADICFAKEAIPLFDPQKLISKIKKLVGDFSFNINLRSRVDNAISGLKDAKRFLKQGEKGKAKIVALTTSFFLMRGLIQYHNSPYTSAKQMFSELEKCEFVLKELSFQIKRMGLIANDIFPALKSGVPPKGG